MPKAFGIFKDLGFISGQGIDDLGIKPDKFKACSNRGKAIRNGTFAGKVKLSDRGLDKNDLCHILPPFLFNARKSGNEYQADQRNKGRVQQKCLPYTPPQAGS